MHYIWQHRLWLQRDMTTIDGRRINVIDPGLLNNNAGPDFFNAKIEIGDELWCGNVEMHVKASDWYNHGHHNNNAYDSVILHVVCIDDTKVKRPDGNEIAQLVMPCNPDFRARYDEMVNNDHEPYCHNELGKLPDIYVTDWLSSLSYERIIQKVDHIRNLNHRLGGNRIETLYVILARSLGFGINSDAFERLALATPLHCLLKHRDSPESIEGTLFGQAGFLDDADDNSFYVERMRQEFTFMSNKFNLKRPVSLGWRMARMRPQNFPHRRIATLAAMICSGFNIAADIFNVRSEDDARKLFDIDLTGYWSRRYNFKSETAKSVKALSHDSITTLIINVVVPMLYCYGTDYRNNELIDTAVNLLHTLKPENNHIIRMFSDAGISCDDAFTSQAIIQLRRNYCEPRKCLYCRIGHRILAAKAH